MTGFASAAGWQLRLGFSRPGGQCLLGKPRGHDVSTLRAFNDGPLSDWRRYCLVQNTMRAKTPTGSKSRTGLHRGIWIWLAVAGVGCSSSSPDNGTGGGSVGGGGTGGMATGGMATGGVGSGGGTGGATGGQSGGSHGGQAGSTGGANAGGQGGTAGMGGHGANAGHGGHGKTGGAGGTSSGGAAGAGGTSKGGGAGGGDAGSSFAPVQAIFDAHCITCHDPAHPIGREFPTYVEMPLVAGSSYAALVNVAAHETCGGTRVVPGQPEQSYLYRKVVDATPCDGLRMPHRGMLASVPPLPDADISTIKTWIAAGARP